jgi:hypothetical protein
MACIRFKALLQDEFKSLEAEFVRSYYGEPTGLSYEAWGPPQGEGWDTMLSRCYQMQVTSATALEAFEAFLTKKGFQFEVA